MEALQFGPHALNEREKWLEWRGDSIGASESGSILGLNPWQSPLQLYARKIGAIEDVGGDPEAMKWGHRLQLPILQGWAEETGKECSEWEIGVRHPDYPWLHSTPDAIAWPTAHLEFGTRTSFPPLVQAKATSVEKKWEDGVPPYVFAQVQQEMLTTRSELAHVAVLFNGRRFERYEVPFDRTWCDDVLLPRTKSFWDRLEALEPPEEVGSADGDALAALFPTDSAEKVLGLPGELILKDERIQALSEAIRDQELERAQLRNEIKATLGDHREGVLPSGVRWTWKEQTREYKAKAAYSAKYRVLRRHNA
tara:strand:- start:172 stop:1098 length:927 start_codon:yes stop_codon:yes gene_type:complete